MIQLFVEMTELKTNEAKLYKSLDNIEGLISHNEADISTWLPNEYEDNLIYGNKNCEWSDFTKELREHIKLDSINKITDIIFFISICFKFNIILSAHLYRRMAPDSVNKKVSTNITFCADHVITFGSGHPFRLLCPCSGSLRR